MIKKIKKKFDFWFRERIFAFFGESVHHPKWVIIIQMCHTDYVPDYDSCLEIISWLKDNCQGSYSTNGSIFNIVNPYFYFAQKDDAMLFKLVWGGK